MIKKIKIGYISNGNLHFEVYVKEEKRSYGKKRFLVTPVKGKGEEWREIKIFK